MDKLQIATMPLLHAKGSFSYKKEIANLYKELGVNYFHAKNGVAQARALARLWVVAKIGLAKRSKWVGVSAPDLISDKMDVAEMLAEIAYASTEKTDLESVYTCLVADLQASAYNLIAKKIGNNQNWASPDKLIIDAMSEVLNKK